MSMKYGNLSFKRELSERKRGHIIWVCVCDCGSEHIAAASDIKRGAVKSCGCQKISRATALGLAQATHGHARGRNSKTATYHSWRAMRQRCAGRSEGHKDNKNYKERGISICDRWNNFENFLADMGERPRGKTLDRFPNRDGNYEPGNCRWATAKEQAANRRSR